MSFDLRLLAFEDMPAAAAFHRAAGALIPGYDTSLHTPDEDLEFYCAKVFPAGPIWGAYATDVLVGHLALKPGWIEHLYVTPSWHGQGIGRALVALAQRDQDELQLFTYQANDRAKRLYEAAGFVAEDYDFDAEHEDRVPNVRYRWRRATSDR